MFNIAVAGTGYVGLVAGVCFAQKGHQVICVDVNEQRVQKLKSGVSPIHEEGLEAFMQSNYEQGRIDYSTDYSYAYKNADFIFIGVGTPEQEDGSANLEYVYTVVDNIIDSIQNDCIIVIKSTVPIGTNDIIEDYMNDKLSGKFRVDIVSNPEFLSQGTAIRDTLQASRIVIGAENTYATDCMVQLYSNFNIPFVLTNRRSAEMIKYASNGFLALKISYMNDIANLCELVGGDITKVAEGMSFDIRIGQHFLNAGVGYGGSCFPKDTKALQSVAQTYGYYLRTMDATIQVNEAQKMILLKKVRKYFDSLKNIRVCVLGLTFKPNTDDLRESPAVLNITEFVKEGAIVSVYDPVGMENFEYIYNLNVTYASSITDALRDAEVCFIFTEWSDFKEIRAEQFIEYMKTPIVIDGRNLYDTENMKDITYESVGR